MRERPGWDDYFLAICTAVAARSHDWDTQNGAVIVDCHHRVRSTGYNGLPANVDDGFWAKRRGEEVLVPRIVTDRGDPSTFYSVDKYMSVTHAESNAIVSARSDLQGCTIYTPLFPCHECAKLIITAGIKRVVYQVMRENPSWAVARELLHQAKVELSVRLLATTDRGVAASSS
jgi:deoxycytidylate deaminase